VYPYEIGTHYPQTQITAVDIDPDVYRIATKYFLQNELPDNVTFIAKSARGFLREQIQKQATYDLIFIDAYNGKSVPDELTTQEFFADLQRISSGPIISNLILDKQSSSDFAQNTLSTMKSIYGQLWTKNVSNNIDYPLDNFIVSTYAFDESYHEAFPSGKLYSDDRRSTEIDLVNMFWSL